MKVIRSTTVLALVIAGSMGAAGQGVNVTGEWIFDVTTDAGGGMPRLSLVQDGNRLTGHYSSENLGEAELTGSVEGGNIRFTFEASAQGFPLRVTYTGTIENDSISGTIDLSGVASGTFTGKRAPR